MRVVMIPLVCIIGQAQQIAQPVSHDAPKEVQPQVSLRPFKPLSLNVVRTAARAQEGPRTEPLQRAWMFYKKFQGSWKPGAAKPSPEDLASFDSLKTYLEKVKMPDWFLQIKAQAGKTIYPDLIFDPNAPGFSPFRQTEETERIKALAIVYLTEHELDRPAAANNGAVTISCLMARTPFDYELHALFARFLADAKRFEQAFEEARYGIYLNPQPNRQDLSFAAFIALMAAKDGWDLIQAMLREAAINPEDSEAVIQEWGPRFKGTVEMKNFPIKK
jgi:hypothetical protein